MQFEIGCVTLNIAHFFLWEVGEKEVEKLVAEEMIVGHTLWLSSHHFRRKTLLHLIHSQSLGCVGQVDDSSVISDLRWD